MFTYFKKITWSKIILTIFILIELNNLTIKKGNSYHIHKFIINNISEKWYPVLLEQLILSVFDLGNPNNYLEKVKIMNSLETALWFSSVILFLKNLKLFDLVLFSNPELVFLDSIL